MSEHPTPVPPSANLAELAAEIEALTPPDALRLAAQLLEHRQAKLAFQIIDRVKQELGAALALRRVAPTPRTTP